MIASGTRRALLSAALGLAGVLTVAAPGTAQTGGGSALLRHHYIDTTTFETVAVTEDICTDRGIERAPALTIPGTAVFNELYGYC